MDFWFNGNIILSKGAKMTLKNRLSSSKTSMLSPEDIKNWGVEGVSRMHIPSHPLLLVKIPSVSTLNEEGKVIRTKPQIAYYDKQTKRTGIDLASNFYAPLAEKLPTPEQIEKWKEREKCLSEEERALLLASIDHEARICGRRYSQEEKKHALGFLIKNETLLKQAIRNERKYQSLSRVERTIFDRSEKERVAKERQEVRRFKTRSYIIEKKNTREPHAWREIPQRN